MNDKIDIRLIYGIRKKSNILFIYINNNPISITHIYFNNLSFEYYKNSSEITLWDKNNKIICSIDRSNIDNIINEIPKYKDIINKFKISF